MARACAALLNCGSRKPIEKVFTGLELIDCINDTTMVEVMLPDSNAPRLTSTIIRWLTASLRSVSSVGEVSLSFAAPQSGAIPQRDGDYESKNHRFRACFGFPPCPIKSQERERFPTRD
jgi:hypothetical protein